MVIRTVATASLVIFIYGMMASMLGTIVPSLGLRLNLGTQELTWLALAQGLGLAVTSVWAGALMDRRGKKPGIAAGLVSSLAGLGLLTHPSGLVSAMIAMGLLGIGGSLVIVGANALVNDASARNKASALNILNLFVGLGGMGTPWVAANLLHSDPVSVAWAAAGMAAFALLVTLSTPIAHAPPIQGKTLQESVFTSPALYVLAGVTFLYTASEFAMWNWLPKFLIGAGLDPTDALNLLSLGFAAGMLIGRLVAATVLSRLPPVMVVLVCEIAAALTSSVTLLLGGGSGTGALVFATGLVMAPVFPTSIAIIGMLFPRGAGTAIGFAITCGFSGLVVSSPIIGMIAGDSAQGIGRALWLIPSLSAAIALLVLGNCKRLSLPIQAQDQD